jgi:exonuclease SbcD
MPFPNKRRYLQGETGLTTVEQQNMRIMEQFTGAYKQLVAKEIDKSKASVMVSHLFINGVELPRTRFHLTEAQEMIFSRQELPIGWAYIACGHIHRPQAIFSNAEHIRYAGSIERLDLGESADDKSVTLVEIRDGQRVGAPQILPLNAVPLYRVDITDLEQIPRLSDLYRDADKALVKYFLQWDASKGYNLTEVRREIERVFPNWYDHEVIHLTTTGQAITSGPRQISNIRETVEMYLEKQIGEKDPLREKLLKRAKILLIQEGY